MANPETTEELLDRIKGEFGAYSRLTPGQRARLALALASVEIAMKHSMDPEIGHKILKDYEEVIERVVNDIVKQEAAKTGEPR